MLPAFATLADLDDRRTGGLASGDLARAQAALDDVSAIIRAETGQNWTNEDDALASDVPGVFATVTLRAALRCLENPAAVTQESIGSYSYSVDNASTDVYLTSSERRLIRREAGLSGGLWTQATTRGELETNSVTLRGETTYLPVDPAGEPMPWTPEPLEP